jgi:hypothetical protein
MAIQTISATSDMGERIGIKQSGWREISVVVSKLLDATKPPTPRSQPQATQSTLAWQGPDKALKSRRASPKTWRLVRIESNSRKRPNTLFLRKYGSSRWDKIGKFKYNMQEV